MFSVQFLRQTDLSPWDMSTICVVGIFAIEGCAGLDGSVMLKRLSYAICSADLGTVV